MTLATTFGLDTSMVVMHRITSVLDAADKDPSLPDTKAKLLEFLEEMEDDDFLVDSCLQVCQKLA